MRGICAFIIPILIGLVQAENCPQPPPQECILGIKDPLECCYGYSNWMNIFLKNQYDCKSYYVCKDGQPVIQYCPEGLLYNIELQRCDNPENSNCEEMNPIPTEPPSEDCLIGLIKPEICCKGVPYWQDVLIKNPEDCRSYYQCVHEKPVLRPCPAGLHWSVAANRCEWPEIAGCEASSTTQSHESTKTTENGHHTEASTTKATSSPGTTVKPSSTTEAGETTENGNGSTASPTNCPPTSTEGPIIDDCLNGLINPEICCKGVPYWKDVLIKNPEDCGTYYQCVHEKPVLRPCPAGLHWSVAANRCEWPGIAGCEASSTTQSHEGSKTTENGHHTEASTTKATSSPGTTVKPSSTTEGGETTENGNGSTTSPTNCPPTSTQGPIIDDCLYGLINPEICCKGVPYWNDVLIKNPEDCGTYYQCVHEKPVLRPCPAGLHWSVAANRCEWPGIAGCEALTTSQAHTKTTESSKPTDASTTKAPSSTVTTANPSSTTEGSVSTATPTNCPPTTSQIPQLDDCLNGLIKPEICCKGVPYWEDVLIKNPEDCGTYYQCVHEKPVLRPCPAGLHWSVAANRCEWPEIAGCEASSTTQSHENTRTTENGHHTEASTTRATSSPGTTVKPSSTTEGSQTTENGNGSTATPTNCPPTSTETPIIDDCLTGLIKPEICCKGVPYWKDVLIKNPEDCGTYYQCVHEKPVLRPCPAGLHWSVAANRCEWPGIAGCEASSTTASHENTKTTENGHHTEVTTTEATSSPGTTVKPSSTTEAGETTENGNGSTATTTNCPPTSTEGPIIDDCLNGLINPEMCCKGVPYWKDVLIKNPEDCGTYYQCVHEKPVLRPCPAGLHWSVTANRCEWPGIAGCKASSTTQSHEGTKTTENGQHTEASTTKATSSPGTTVKPSSTTEGSETTENGNGSTATTTNCPPTSTEGPIIDDCLNGLIKPEICCKGVPYWKDVLIKNPEDCGTYYQCVHEKPVLRPCPAGLHWSVAANRCEWPGIAGCEALTTSQAHTKTTESSKPTDASTTKAPSSTVTTANPSSTTEGSVSTATSTNCPPTTPQIPQLDDCLNGLIKPEICCKGVPYWEDVLIKNPEDCGTYYQCVHEKPVLRPCPAGLHWSVTANRCEWPEIAGCEASSTTASHENTRTTENGYHTEASTTKATSSPGTTVKPSSSTEGSETTENGNGSTASPTNCPPTSTEGPIIDDCLNGLLNPEMCCKGVPYWKDVLIKNPEDCGTYYQCVHEKPVLRPCPAGLHWSVAANRCEWPGIAGCEASTTTASHENTKTTENGHHTEASTTKATSSPGTTVKPSSTTEAGETTENSNGSTASPTNCPPTSTEGPIIDDCLNGLINPEICCKGVPYWKDVLIKNPEDCGTYYQCVHEKPVLRPCPAGLHWSVAANRCEWPGIAGCEASSTTASHEGTKTTESSKPTDASTTKAPSSTVTTAKPSSTTEESVSTATPTNCPPTTPQLPQLDDCLNGLIKPEICCKGVPYWKDVLIKNPEDCGTYYQCVHEKPVLRPCPAGLHWSVAANRCEWPDTAGCEASSTTASHENTRTTENGHHTEASTTKATSSPGTTVKPSSTTEAGETTENGNGSTATTTNCPPTSTEGPIIDDCLNGLIKPEICCKGVPYWKDVLIKNPEDCGTYYQCVHEKPVLRPCPAGLHWSVAVNRCEWPGIAGCEASSTTASHEGTKTTESSKPTDASTSKAPSTTVTSAKPSSTTEGSVSTATPTNCPPTTPEIPHLDDCLNGLIKPEVCCKGVPYWKDVLIRNPEDCGTYYQCVHEKPVLRPCPAGLHWSVAANRCEWPEIAGCEANAQTTSRPTNSPITSTTEKGTSEGNPVTSTKPPCTENPSSQCLSGLGDLKECCKGVPYWKDVLLKNPEDCGTYYQCVHEVPILRPCPAGLHWSVAMNRCEWPQIAKCRTSLSNTVLPEFLKNNFLYKFFSN